MTLKHSGKRVKTAEVANSAIYYKILIIITGKFQISQFGHY